MKKVLSLLLAVTMLLSLCSVSVFAKPVKKDKGSAPAQTAKADPCAWRYIGEDSATGYDPNGRIKSSNWFMFNTADVSSMRTGDSITFEIQGGEWKTSSGIKKNIVGSYTLTKVGDKQYKISYKGNSCDKYKVEFTDPYLWVNSTGKFETSPGNQKGKATSVKADTTFTFNEKKMYLFVHFVANYYEREGNCTPCTYTLNYHFVGEAPAAVSVPASVSGIQSGSSLKLAVAPSYSESVYGLKSDYTVRYLELGTNRVLSNPKVVSDLVVNSFVTEKAIEIRNYDLVGDNTQSITIKRSSGNDWTFHGWYSDPACTVPVSELTNITANKDVYGYWEVTPVQPGQNVITFYYKQQAARYALNYHVLGEAPEGTSAPASVIGIAAGSNVTLAAPLANVEVDSSSVESYIVKYLEVGTDRVLAAEKFVAGVPVDNLVEEKALTIKDYNLVSEDTQSIVILPPETQLWQFDGWYLDSSFTQPVKELKNVSSDNDVYGHWNVTSFGNRKNQIVFYYEKQPEPDNTYTLNYHFVGSAPEGVVVPASVNGIKSGNSIKLANAPTYNEGVADFREDYIVRYLEAGTDRVLATEKVVRNLPVNTFVTENAIDIQGYNLVSDATQPLTIEYNSGNDWTFHGWFSDPSCTTPVSVMSNITSDKDVYGYWKATPVDPSKNVITFYYEKQPEPEATYTLNYHVLGNAPEGSSAPASVIGIRKGSDVTVAAPLSYTGKIPATTESYTVKYLEEGTDNVLATQKNVSGVLAGTTVNEFAVNIKNYHLVSANRQTLTVLPPQTDVWTFDGWYLDPAFTQPVTELKNVSSDQDVYGHWTVSTVDNKNEIVFYYTQHDVFHRLDYHVIGDAPEGVSVPDPNTKIVDGSNVKLADPLSYDGSTEPTLESYVVKYLEVGTNKVLAEEKFVSDVPSNSEISEVAKCIRGYALVSDNTQSIIIHPDQFTFWTFDGWYADATFTEPVVTVIRNVTADQNVYGRWTCNTVDYPENEIIFYYEQSEAYTLTYHVIGDAPEGPVTPDPVTGIPYDTDMILAAPLSHNESADVLPTGGYTVSYYNLVSNTRVADDKVVTDEDANIAGERPIEISGYTLVGADDKTTTISKTMKEAWIFTGWCLDPECTQLITEVNITSDMDVYGRWTRFWVNNNKDHIAFYYKHDPTPGHAYVSYTVRYLDLNTFQRIADDRFVDGIRQGSTVTESPIDIPYYAPISGSIDQTINGNEVITFYYYYLGGGYVG